MNDVTAYLEAAHPPPDPLLLELERHGRKDGIPIVSRETGRFLATLVHAMQANRILEIGTAYGYSTLWMALAQPPVGTIWTIDVDVARTDVARSYFERAGEAESIVVLNQNALEVLETFPHRNLDIVFIDADKTEYRAYLDLAIPRLKRSGLVIVDNCLWSGRVAQPERADDTSETRALRDFNRYFLAHPDLAATILPLGDGTGIGARVR
ncbi:MAG TPA: O-methyltransferase [Candidatus Dormibacteraeota bacterium]|nr:O-methyltransferase [Candidatus Dormibacteraeota bacterium]